jgi:hypothetical protein
VSFDQVTDAEMQAARILTGATMVAFLAARMFRNRAPAIRLLIATVYIVGIVAFVTYVLI